MLRLLGTFAHSRRERELADELASHLQLHIDDNIRAGMPPAEARRQALLKFGGLEAIKEQHRDRGGSPSSGTSARICASPARLLRKAPGFSVTAIVTIALAVGVNAAIFTVLNAAALQRLPVPAGDRLATRVDQLRGRGTPRRVRLAQHAVVPGIRSRAGSVARVRRRARVCRGSSRSSTLGGAGTASGARDAGDLQLLRRARHPRGAGRTLKARDCAPGAPATAVLSHRLWQTAFSGDPSVVGRTVSLNRAPFVVVGVAQAGFTGTELVAEDVYVPVIVSDDDRSRARPAVERERELADRDGTHEAGRVARLGARRIWT